jgi:hypothetical protein
MATATSERKERKTWLLLLALYGRRLARVIRRILRRLRGESVAALLILLDTTDWTRELRDATQAVLTAAALASAASIVRQVLPSIGRSLLSRIKRRVAAVVSQIQTTWARVISGIRRAVVRIGNRIDPQRRLATYLRKLPKAAERIAELRILPAIGGGAGAAGTELAYDGHVNAKIWFTRLDSRVRDSHERAHGQTVPAFEDFTINGSPAQYPGDPRLPVEETANCILPGTMMSGVFDAAMRSRYSGEAVEIICRSGRRIALTPNHPVLTENGFVPAGSLQSGDELVAYDSQVDLLADCRSGCDDEYDVPAEIEKVFESFVLRSAASGIPVKRASRLVDDLHGDGRFVQGDIEIVRADWPLLNHVESGSVQETGDSIFALEAVQLAKKTSQRPGTPFLGAGFSTASSIPSGPALPFNRRTVGLESGPFQGFRLGLAARLNASLFESAVDSESGTEETFGDGVDRFAVGVGGDDFGTIQRQSSGSRGVLDLSQEFVNERRAAPQLACNLITRHPAVVELDSVLSVRQFRYTGHVYDLQSPNGYIVGNGIFLSNCRCSLVYRKLRPEELDRRFRGTVRA